MKASKRYQRVPVALLRGVVPLNHVDRRMLGIMKPHIMPDIADFGRLLAAFRGTCGWMSQLAGGVAEWVGKNRLFIGSHFLRASINLVVGCAKTFDPIRCLPTITGVGLAGHMPAGLAPKADFLHSRICSLAPRIDMPLSESIYSMNLADSSCPGAMIGADLSVPRVQRNLRDRAHVDAIALSMAIPTLLFFGLKREIFHFIAAGFCFGFGIGVFHAHMPVLCRFITRLHRPVTGVAALAFATVWLRRSSDAWNFGTGLAMTAGILFTCCTILLLFLRQKTDDTTYNQLLQV
jgi:hypothetical protein